jgi:uncharacterized protein YdaU (DUF1376 family)
VADKYPWFPFYAADFLTDEKTLAMSFRELGLYVTLLCHQWIQGSIPADRSRAQATLKLGSSHTGDDADFAAFDKVVSECFEAHPTLAGRLMNRRLADIQEQQAARHERLSAAGRKGGRGLSEAQPRLKPGLSEAQANKRERKKENKETTHAPSGTWVTDLGNLWKADRGKPPYPRIGKALRDLVAAHGLRQVRAAWVGYLEERRGKSYASPEDFAQNYRVFREKYAQVTNDAGDGGFVPIPDEPEAAA